MSNYCFLPEAEAEYLQVVQFYEEQKQGLGYALILEFERVTDLIRAKPETWKLVHPSGIRVIVLIRFPYSVFYRVISAVIQVTALPITGGVRVTG